MRALVSHLIAGDPDLQPVFVGLARMGEVVEERRAAFSEACREAGLKISADSAVLFPTLDSIDGAAVEALTGRANALVAVNDIVGLILLEELRGQGIDVPRRLAVTGYDDSPLRRISRPLLTTFSLPVHAIGARAGRRLLEEILGKEPPAPSERLAGKLLRGQSTRNITV
jgi:LacI family transcriptional regulator